ncbi:hypothetical protein [Kushneria indalinina]|nr:hypothetical protein [Kushneria indalinina]
MSLDPRNFSDETYWDNVVYQVPGAPPRDCVQLSAFLPPDLKEAQMLANAAEEVCSELDLGTLGSFLWHGEKEREELIVNGALNPKATDLLRKRVDRKFWEMLQR